MNIKLLSYKEAKVISKKYLYSPSNNEYLHWEEMMHDGYKVANKKDTQRGKIVTYVKYTVLDD